MENAQEKIKTRLSTLVLIKDIDCLILNDRLRIKYKHGKTFNLIWILCKLLKSNEAQDLKGVPPSMLIQALKAEGTNISEQALATLWHDEVLFKRHHNNIFNLYEVYDIRNNVYASSGKLVSDVFQAIFDKTNPPENSGYHKNSRFYTITGDFEQIFLFETSQEANRCGYDEKGVSDITKHRSIRGDVGVLYCRYTLNILEDGTEDSKVYVKMVNLAKRPIASYMIPIWAFGEIKNIKAWQKDGTPIDLEITSKTDGEKNIIEFIIYFPELLYPGNIIEFYYSLTIPQCYCRKNEYFDWYFDQPQSLYHIDIYAPKNKVITRAVVYEGQNEDTFQAKLLSPKHLQWVRYFPAVGLTYKICFNLEDVQI